ncbi:MAG: class II glutamine amidotransferase [Gammaproteobacteria bacterium]|nr:class II glutamine amidotransferase [Gammaproteobacteria bacterium]
MRRFTFYKGKSLALSALLTEPEHSLIHQSFEAREREEPLNGDGFGVAWYSPGHDEPALFRSATPAWSNQNLRELARVSESPCVLAHVRAATEGLQVGERRSMPTASTPTAAAVMVSSEPLSGDSGWETVPVNHFARIEPNLGMAIEPIAS